MLSDKVVVVRMSQWVKTDDHSGGEACCKSCEGDVAGVEVM